MIEKINLEIKANEGNINTDLISDGWHTFGDLYYHRSLLFIKLCKVLAQDNNYFVYKAKKHYDNGIMEDYFTLGIRLSDNTYISYHMKDEDWDACDFAKELEKSPIEGKYTSIDAINNLMKI